MRENVDVLRAIEEARREGKKGALATVIRVRGSAYRREGAKMYVEESGRFTGLISGGCLERDVAETARTVIEQGQPVIKRYELDEDLVWGLGLGCPGTVEILIEPVSNETHPAFALWTEDVLRGRAGALCTVMNQDSDALSLERRLWIPETGSAAGSLGDVGLNRMAAEWTRTLLRKQHPRPVRQSFTLADGTTADVFIDIAVPEPTVMIFGAGHDAMPVARLSQSLGYSTVVIDPRESYNTEERFPGAARLLVTPAGYAEKVAVTHRSYLIIMNHHLERDKEALRFAISSKAPYIGLLGPLSRRNRLLELLVNEGCVFAKSQMDRLFSPIGLDIGADSADEIAVSILAEIVALRSGHGGGPLRNKDRIHLAAVRSG
ncbi:XdhC family protein [Brevibacillus brevis]|uniref:XdhC family protein n=1 Tax=Brevibacillus brevis TaxID=1393 RepID=A0ABY9SWQ8_BREBE|nr:XdhC family protein [Brevibacillus brevis]WNC12263.1 XdhC family protein [Brevibacillus brevis]